MSGRYIIRYTEMLRIEAALEPPLIWKKLLNTSQVWSFIHNELSIFFAKIKRNGSHF